jgi:hypothetical protein
MLSLDEHKKLAELLDIAGDALEQAAAIVEGADVPRRVAERAALLPDRVGSLRTLLADVLWRTLDYHKPDIYFGAYPEAIRRRMKGQE